jgi:hypothetical protein
MDYMENNTVTATRQEQLDALAHDAQRRIEQQLDPTDCALSIWADGITRCKLELEIELEANGGYASFLELQTIEGAPVNARMIDTKFGSCWAVCDSNGRKTGEFLPICDAADDCECGTPYVAKDKKLRKRGYRQVAVLRKAIVKVCGSGRGLSGYAQACVIDPLTGQGRCAWLSPVTMV